MEPDPFDLQRFVDAQQPVFDTALGELRAGRKASHWMWFIFPQHRALGRSAMAHRYGIASPGEARAYLAHPLLGPRLLQCCAALLDTPPGLSAHAILGAPDDTKLRSCVSLFRAARPDLPVWDAVLQRFYGGQADPATLQLLDTSS